MATNYMFIFLLLLVAYVSVSLSFEQKRKSSNQFLPPLVHETNPKGFLKILVIGDWGRKGRYNQSLIANQMGVIGKKLNIDFVISTGDNFYNHGLWSVNDPAFRESFANIYTAQSLQKPWYAVLGNHDYHLNSTVQLSPKLKEIDKRWNCKRALYLQAGVVDFVLIDTTPFVNKFIHRLRNFNGKQKEYLKEYLEDLREVLRESRARWKVVVGHHAIKSAGVHGDTKELNNIVRPILEANNVDMYINGHDHCLQHISTRGRKIEFFTSGGGSKAWAGGGRTNYDADEYDLKFYNDGQGFMSVQYDYSKARIYFYDAFGKTIYNFGKNYRK